MVLGLGSRDTQIRRSIETKQQLKCIALYFLHFFKLFKFFFVSPDTKPFSIIRSFFILGLYFIIIIFFLVQFYLVEAFTLSLHSHLSMSWSVWSILLLLLFSLQVSSFIFYDLRSSVKFLDFWDQRNVIFLFLSCFFLITTLWNFIRRILLTKRASYHRKLFEQWSLTW